MHGRSRYKCACRSLGIDKRTKGFITKGVICCEALSSSQWGTLWQETESTHRRDVLIVVVIFSRIIGLRIAKGAANQSDAGPSVRRRAKGDGSRPIRDILRAVMRIQINGGDGILTISASGGPRNVVRYKTRSSWRSAVGVASTLAEGGEIQDETALCESLG